MKINSGTDPDDDPTFGPMETSTIEVDRSKEERGTVTNE